MLPFRGRRPLLPRALSRHDCPWGAVSGSPGKAAERALEVQFGTPVRIVGMKRFPYSLVWRCTLKAAGGAVPPTVIVRVLQDHPTRSHPARLHNEQAALEFLYVDRQWPRAAIHRRCRRRWNRGYRGPGRRIPRCWISLLGDDRQRRARAFSPLRGPSGCYMPGTAGRSSAYDDRRAQLGPVVEDDGHARSLSSIKESWRVVRDVVARLWAPSATRRG